VLFFERIESTLPNVSELSWICFELTLPKVKWAGRSSQTKTQSSDPFGRVFSISAQENRPSCSLARLATLQRRLKAK